MSFYYEPGVQDRRGELLAPGIAAAGQSIADAITAVKAKHDELRGYQTVLKALAADPANGLDPDTVDKMSLSEAKNSILASEIRRNQAASQKQQQIDQAGMALPGAIARNMQPRTDLAGGPTDVANLMVSGDNPVKTTPGMTPMIAQITALSQNPKAVMSPQGQEVFKNMLKTMSIVPRTPQPFSSNGVTGVVDPLTGRITQPRVVADKSNVGLLPPGTSVKVVNGERFAVRPDGWMKSLGAIPATKGNVFDLFGGGDDKTNAPAGSTAPQVGDIQSGDNGDQYKFNGGDPADPANWEKVDDE